MNKTTQQQGKEKRKLVLQITIELWKVLNQSKWDENKNLGKSVE
jgi:hypothetical protein